MSLPSRALAQRASGPASLRQRLGAARSRLYGAAAAARAVDRLHARIPAAVFGGDLLETLSSTLRGHLIAPDQPASAASGRTRERVTPMLRPTASPGRR